jgi:ATP-dependent RNA helicase DeaD
LESYIHRVGRTGRAGQRGTAISLVSPRQKSIMARFAKGTKAEIEEKLLIPGRHMDQGRKQRAAEREAHFAQLREQKKREEMTAKRKKLAPLEQALKKNKKVKPGYKKKLAREVEQFQKQYDQKKKREALKAARKSAGSRSGQTGR